VVMNFPSICVSCNGKQMPKAKPPKKGVLAIDARSADEDKYYSADAATVSRRRLVAADDANPLGSATEAELTAVVKTALGSDPNLEAPEIVIAVDALARVIAERMGHSDWQNDPKRLAVFIVSDRPRNLAVKLQAKQEPIIDNGSQSLTAKLWVAAPTLASGYYYPLTATDSGGMFSEVAAKGVGKLAAFVFDPTATAPEIRYYPGGLSDPDRVQRFRVGQASFSLKVLDEILARFHDDNFITPDAVPSAFDPWSNGAKYIPRKDTEAFFQAVLKVSISVAIGRKYRIDFEHKGTEGRCDLLISSQSNSSNGGWVFHAVLELKVLRSLTSGAHSVSATVREKAIQDGLIQAIAYKRERAAENGMLCCYDMRAPKHYNGTTCFDPIKAKAARNKIELRHYRVYGTSADLRAEKYGGKTSPTA
jgi:hypothetical protein